ncbi:tetratricopeptide repeat-containing sulfotransferase family protein [Solemya pervernicosa gill symbiont]|uniref:tetratricopeptide repeat-containing sulfotransferase family protein n=1 Tax=Solemya pervernicosa gill symbiont TaxID=642797 RepID=UPI001F2E8F0E|nr:sulfotransferase family protein [Solemya pervernicosa gill symbiont]
MPPHIIKHIEEGMSAAKALTDGGDQEAAEHRLQQLISEIPKAIDPLRMLVGLMKARKVSSDELVDLQARLVMLSPESDAFLCDAAQTLLNLKRYAEAERCARRAVGIRPTNPQAHNVLGMVLAEMHQPDGAEYHYKQALSQHIPVGKLCANLAFVLKQQGKIEESAAFYRKAVALEPDNAVNLLTWAKLEESLKHFDTAWDLVERARKVSSDKACLVLESTLLRREGRLEEALEKLNGIDVEDEKDVFLISYFNERAQVLDKLKRFDEAFVAIDQSNSLIRKTRESIYDSASNRTTVERYEQFYQARRIKEIPCCGNDPDVPEQATPLFIVGFPRSGTTMVEQILTSHPNISAGDELTYLWRISQLAPTLLGRRGEFPEFLSKLDQSTLEAGLKSLREYYLCNAIADRVVGSETKLFTDKMPLNEMHLGLINLIFNDAPIIHMIRHPLDVVLSSYFNDLTHGDNCSYSLVSAAQHYALIFELVEHYKANLDMRYHAVRYEDIVDNPETHIRELLEFVGEEWDDRCLDFHKNKRFARTASYAQVTEKLYTRSVFRYKNYRTQLEAIIPILEPAISALGYTVE